MKSVALIILIFGAISFVEGHGMHLSANAIARHLTSAKDSSLFALDYSFDEIMGHLFWDSGVILIAFGMILVGFQINPQKLANTKQALIVLASLIYGFTYFVNAVEGQSVYITLPMAAAIPLAIWWTANLKKYSDFKESSAVLLSLFPYGSAWSFSHLGNMAERISGIQ